MRADPLTVVNGRVGYSFGRIKVVADVINILNSRDKEIEYFYASRLPGEPSEGIRAFSVQFRSWLQELK